MTNPTLPALVEIALATPNIAPTNFPRTDLVTTFLTGIPGVNQPKAFSIAGDRRRVGDAAPEHRDRADAGSAAEPARPARRPARRPGGDLAGYPNGRRPNDDVVDISLVAVMGGLCVANGDGRHLQARRRLQPERRAARRRAAFNLHDGVDQAGAKVKAAGPLLPAFPYLGTPIARRA